MMSTETHKTNVLLNFSILGKLLQNFHVKNIMLVTQNSELFSKSFLHLQFRFPVTPLNTILGYHKFAYICMSQVTLVYIK